MMVKAFLDYFTPEDVIDILTDEINRNKEMICDLMKMIYKDNLSEEEKSELNISIMDKCKSINQKNTS